MHGEKTCPFLPCAADCRKDKCEIWDEYAQNCAVNEIVRLLRTNNK